MRRVLLALLVVLVLIVIAGFVLVNGAVLPRLTNMNPGVFALKYVSARWKPPFSVDVEGFELQIQSDGYRVWIAADHASGTFHPMSMFGKLVKFTDITASGVAVRVALPKPLEGTPEKRLPTFDNMAEASPPSPGPVFSVELTKLTDVRVREVWVDGFRYTGEIGVAGGFILHPTQSVQIVPSNVVIDGGVLLLPNGLEAKLEPSTISGLVREVSLDTALTPAAFRNLDATAQLGFHAPNLNLINSLLLADVPDVQLLYGAGNVSMTVAVDGGVVTDTSEVLIHQRKLGVRVPYFDIVGMASLKLEAKKERVNAALKISQFELDARADDTKVATGKEFELKAVTTSTDLTAPQNVDVTLTLADAHAPSIEFLDQFIPSGTGVVLSRGSGHVSVDASLSTKTQRAKGTLQLSATNVELHNRGAQVTGTLDVKAKLVSFNLKTREMDLSGSELRMSQVEVLTQNLRFQRSWLSAFAEEAVFAPATKHPWHAKLGAGASNLQPMLALISGNLEIPKWIVGSLDLPNASAKVTLDVEGKDIMLAPLSVRTTGIDLDARVTLKELPNKNLEPHGVGLVRLGPFQAGMAIDGGTITPILLGGPQWYAKQLDGGS